MLKLPVGCPDGRSHRNQGPVYPDGRDRGNGRRVTTDVPSVCLTSEVLLALLDPVRGLSGGGVTDTLSQGSVGGSLEVIGQD